MSTALDRLLTARTPLTYALQRLPLLRQASEAAYAAFARRRQRFGGRAACALARPAPLDAASREELARRAKAGGWSPLPADGETPA